MAPECSGDFFASQFLLGLRDHFLQVFLIFLSFVLLAPFTFSPFCSVTSWKSFQKNSLNASSTSNNNNNKTCLKAKPCLCRCLSLRAVVLISEPHVASVFVGSFRAATKTALSMKQYLYHVPKDTIPFIRKPVWFVTGGECFGM